MALQEVDVRSALRDAPRPHYLVRASLDEHAGLWLLQGDVRFPSHVPSVRDRMHGPFPHVNAGDAYFGIWNGVYLLAERFGAYGMLATRLRSRHLAPIPADTPVGLDVEVFGIGHAQGAFDTTAKFRGSYSLGGRQLMAFSGEGVAKTRNG